MFYEKAASFAIIVVTVEVNSSNGWTRVLPRWHSGPQGKGKGVAAEQQSQAKAKSNVVDLPRFADGGTRRTPSFA